jgi:hypothetical protein
MHRIIRYLCVCFGALTGYGLLAAKGGEDNDAYCYFKAGVGCIPIHQPDRCQQLSPPGFCTGGNQQECFCLVPNP